MRAWMNGELLPDPTGPAVSVTDHGFTVGDGVFEAIKVVDGQPFALDLHLERLARSAAGTGPAGRRRGRRYAAAWRPCSTARTCRSAGSGSPTPAGPAPLGSGRGDAPPTLVVVADAMEPWPRRRPRWRRCPGRATSAGRWPGSRPRRTPRTSSRSPPRSGAAPARRSSPTSPATCARAPAPTSSTSSTASCARRRSTAAAWPASPGRWSWSGTAAVEVDEPIEVVDAGQRGVPGLDDARRAGRVAAGTTAS